MALGFRWNSRLIIITLLLFCAIPSAAAAVSGYTKQKMLREMESARLLLSQGETDRARAALQRVLRLDPNHLSAHHLLAEMSLSLMDGMLAITSA